MKSKTVEVGTLALYFKSSLRSDPKEFKKIVNILPPLVFVAENFLKKELKLKSADGISCYLNICGVTKIAGLNREYRQKPKKTDVLSFPIFENSDEISAARGPVELGDIFICREVALAQAKRLNVSYENEIIHLFVHGFLHLLGYDHERSKKDALLMNNLEKKLVERIHRKMKK